MARHRRIAGTGALWSKKIWCKGVPWKMAFLSWRVFKRKLPVNDVLRTMGYQTVSKCTCCINPGCDTLQHIFGVGETTRQVWDYFSRSMDLSIPVRSERHVFYDWWMAKIKNRLLKFIAARLPMLILWELWVNYTSCKYGGGRSSAARVIYKVVKDVSDCIQRKWPLWDPFPPNWKFIMQKAEEFGCSRIVQKTCWCRPRTREVKINWAVDWDEGACAFFTRNSRGRFCSAGIYSKQEGGDIRILVREMLQDCWAWCRRKKIASVCLESDSWGDGGWEFLEEWPNVRCSRCTERVNRVAGCLLRCCAGNNLVFWKNGGLPRGLRRVLALEGVLHFVLVPGIDGCG
ncbi:PREDICTED: uncharacterized protein LOC109149028 [Ipomoea nil]|uniref:uncharacterized protein LOC109149028 n=1 Tax=Ipomoea nil TaxID=35883 RepID=UPI0009017542|nr:PREDICTED: uncharacterized protein LOC109149028 [Ipomoea nil]